MLFRFWVKLALYFNTFSFAFLVTAFLNRGYVFSFPYPWVADGQIYLEQTAQRPFVSYLLVAFVAASTLFVLSMVGQLKRMNPRHLTVKSVSTRPELMTAYAFSNVMPFAFNNLASSTQFDRLTVCCFFLVFLGVISARGEYFYMNPMMTLWGYRLVELVDKAEGKWALITKRRLLPGDIIKAVDINENDAILEID